MPLGNNVFSYVFIYFVDIDYLKTYSGVSILNFSQISLDCNPVKIIALIFFCIGFKLFSQVSLSYSLVFLRQVAF